MAASVILYAALAASLGVKLPATPLGDRILLRLLDEGFDIAAPNTSVSAWLVVRHDRDRYLVEAGDDDDESRFEVRTVRRAITDPPSAAPSHGALRGRRPSGTASDRQAITDPPSAAPSHGALRGRRPSGTASDRQAITDPPSAAPSHGALRGRRPSGAASDRQAITDPPSAAPSHGALRGRRPSGAASDRQAITDPPSAAPSHGALRGRRPSGAASDRQAIAEMEVQQRAIIAVRRLKRKHGRSRSGIHVVFERSVAPRVRGAVARAVLAAGFGLRATAGGRTLCVRETLPRLALTHAVGECPAVASIRVRSLAAVNQAVVRLLRPVSVNPPAAVPRVLANAPVASPKTTATATASTTITTATIATTRPRDAPAARRLAPLRPDPNAPADTLEEPFGLRIDSDHPPTSVWAVAVRASGGVMLRPTTDVPTEVDATLTAGVAARRRIWGGRIDASWLRARSADARIEEWTIVVGPSWQLALEDALVVAAALRVGVGVHDYTVLDDSGTDLDLVADVPFEIGWRVVDGLWVEGTVILGITASGRTHRIDGDAVWGRGPWRLSALVGLAYEFDL